MIGILRLPLPWMPANSCRNDKGINLWLGDENVFRTFRWLETIPYPQVMLSQIKALFTTYSSLMLVRGCLITGTWRLEFVNSVGPERR